MEFQAILKPYLKLCLKDTEAAHRNWKIEKNVNNTDL